MRLLITGRDILTNAFLLSKILIQLKEEAVPQSMTPIAGSQGSCSRDEPSAHAKNDAKNDATSTVEMCLDCCGYLMSEQYGS